MCYWVAVVGNHKQGGPAGPFHPHRRRQQLRSNAYGKKKKKKKATCVWQNWLCKIANHASNWLHVITRGFLF